MPRPPKPAPTIAMSTWSGTRARRLPVPGRRLAAYYDRVRLALLAAAVGAHADRARVARGVRHDLHAEDAPRQAREPQLRDPVARHGLDPLAVHVGDDLHHPPVLRLVDPEGDPAAVDAAGRVLRPRQPRAQG